MQTEIQEEDNNSNNNKGQSKNKRQRIQAHLAHGTGERG